MEAIERKIDLSAQDLRILEQSQIIPKNTPREQVMVFANVCRNKNLDPFSKEIYLTKYNTKHGVRYTIITGIDGYRGLAHETGLYSHTEDYVFDEGLTEYEMIQGNRKLPTTATSTVWKLNPAFQQVPVTSTVRWSEYAPNLENRDAFMWKRMPFLMLGKCAEALALRKAFSRKLSGIYLDSEMQQAKKNPEQEGNPDEHEKIMLKVKDYQDADELKSHAKGLVDEAKEAKCNESEIKELQISINKKIMEIRKNA